jgi:hypothetical protein
MPETDAPPQAGSREAASDAILPCLPWGKIGPFEARYLTCRSPAHRHLTCRTRTPSSDIKEGRMDSRHNTLPLVLVLAVALVACEGSPRLSGGRRRLRCSGGH